MPLTLSITWVVSSLILGSWTGLPSISAQVKVTKPSVSIVALEGDTVTLPCNNATTSTHNIYWWYLKDNRTLLEVLFTAEDGHRILRNNAWRWTASLTGNNADIQIKNIKFSRDNGYFFCYFGTRSTVVMLDIYVPVTTATIVPDLSKVPLATNLPNTIKCITSKSRPVPHFKWFIRTPNNDTIEDLTFSGQQFPWKRDVDKPVQAVGSLVNFQPKQIMEGNYLWCEVSNNVTKDVIKTRSGPATIYYPPAERPVFDGYQKFWQAGDIARLSCTVTNVNPVAAVQFKLECPYYKNDEVTFLKKTITYLVAGKSAGNVTGYFQITIKEKLQHHQCLCWIKHIPTDTRISSDGSGMFRIDLPYYPKYVNLSQEAFTGKENTSGVVSCIADRSQPAITKDMFSWSPDCGIVGASTFKIDESGHATLKGNVRFDRVNHGKVCLCLLNFPRSSNIVNASATFNVTYDPSDIRLSTASFVGKEGDTKLVTCSVDTANPPIQTSQLSWSRDCGIPIGATEYNVDQSGRTIMSSDIELNRSYHGKDCECILEYSNEVRLTNVARFSIDFSPRFVQIPETIISGRENDTKELTCQADLANPPVQESQMSWSQNCGFLNDQSTFTTNASGFASLSVSVRLHRLQHDKTCVCVLNYPGTVQFNATTTFHVLFNPKSLTVAPEPFSGHEGESKTISCIADGANPPIEKYQLSWSQECRVIGESNFSRVHEFGQSVLTGRVQLNRERHDKECTCSLNYSPDVRLVKKTAFNVFFSPRRLELTKDQFTGKEGDLRNITCSAERANPQIQKSHFVWSPDCGLTNSDSRFTIDVSGRASISGSVELLRSRHGVTCTCSLKYPGAPELSESATFDVTFTSNSLTLSKEAFSGHEDDIIEAKCIAASANPPIKKNEFSWSPECGVTIGQSTLRIHQSGQTILTSSPIQLSRRNHGEKCVCTLRYRDQAPKSAAAIFNVTFFPRTIDLTKAPFTGKENRTSIITCTVGAANPPVEQSQLTWSPDCGVSDTRSQFSLDQSNRATLTGMITLKRDYHGKVCSCSLAYPGANPMRDRATYNVTFSPTAVTLSKDSFTGMEGSVSKFITCSVDRANPPVKKSQFTWSPECGISLADSRFDFDESGRGILRASVMFDRANHEKTCTCSLRYGELRLQDSAVFNVIYAPAFGPTLVGYDRSYKVRDVVSMTCSVRQLNPTSDNSLILSCPNYFSGEISSNDVRHVTPSPERNHGDMSVTFRFFAKKSLNGKQCTCYARHASTGFEKRTNGDGFFNVTYPPTTLSLSTSDNVLTGTVDQLVTLNCTVDAANPSITADHFSWFSDCPAAIGDIVLSRGDDDSVTMSRSMRLRKGDHGKRCICYVSYGLKQLHAYADINVLYPPTVVMLANGPMTTTEGTTITLRCVTDSANPPVTKEQFQLLGDCGSFQGQKTYRRINTLGASVTQTTTVMRDDDGKTCTCRVTYGATVLRDSKAFDIQYSARITPIPLNQRTINVQEGKNVTMTCEVAAKPTPTIEWRRNNTLIASTITGSGKNRYTSLVSIARISRRENGRYRCSAENGVGAKDSVHYDIIVKFGSSVMTLSTQAFSGVAGTTTTITCSVDAANPAVKQTDLMWSDECLRHLHDTVFKQNQNGGASLTSKADLTRDLDGVICTCSLKGSKGVALEESSIFDVTYPPARGPTLVGYNTISVDDMASMYCTVEDVNPAKDVSFTLTCPEYDATEIHSTVTTQTQTNDVTKGNATAHFTFTVKRSLNGRRCTCFASHSPTGFRGSTNGTGTFEVTYAPRSVKLSHESFSGIDGTNSSVTCSSADANPPVQEQHFSWSLDCGEPIRAPRFVVHSNGSGTVTRVISLKKEMDGKSCICFLSYFNEPRITDIATFRITFAPIATATRNIYNVAEGNDLDISCEIQANPRPTIRWLYENVDVDSNRVVTTDEGKHQYASVLSLKNTTRNDRGRYTCVAENGVGVPDDAKMDVNIFYAPRKVTLSRDSFTGIDGTNSTITCSTDGANPPVPESDVSWSRDCGIPIGQQNFTNARHGGAIVTRVTRLTKDLDGKTCDCVVSYKQPGISDSATFNISFSPTISVEKLVYDIKEGTDLVIVCKIWANPRPRVVWRLPDGTTQNRDVVDDSNRNRFTSTLRLTSVDKSAAGRYACSADNGIGSDGSREVDVNVLYAPRTVTLSHESFSGIDGERSNVTCRADDAYPLVKREHFSWSPDCGTPIKKQLFSYDVGGSASVTMVIELRKEYDGKTCTCFLNYPDTPALSDNATFRIEFSPTVTASQPTYAIVEGDDLDVSCEISANPQPMVAWHYGNTPINDGHVIIAANGSHKYRSVLSLKRVTRDNRGQYRCTADNGIGDAGSAILNVDVTFPPNVTAEELSYAIVEGNDLELTCNIWANPRANVTWFYGLSPVDAVNTVTAEGDHRYRSVLSLKQVNRTDAGQYTCRAVNRFGSASSAPMVVDVQYGAKITDTSPTKITVNVGDRIHLMCGVEANPEPNIVWHFRDMRWAPNKSEILQSGLYLSSWAKSDVRIEDSGIYRCKAWNNIGTPVTKSFNVTVIYAETNVSLTKDAFSGLAGETKTIYCIAIGVTSPDASYFIWSAGCGNATAEIGMKLGANESVSVGRNVSLRREDHGQRCTCSYNDRKSPMASDTAEFNVTFKPSIEEITSPSRAILDARLTVIEDESVTVQVRVWANPPPTVELELGGASLESTMTKVNETWYNVVANVTKIQRQQRGQLVVEARNHLGHALVKAFIVVVHYQPSVAVVTIPANGTIREHENVTLNCTVDSVPGVTEVSWKHARNSVDTILEGRNNLSITVTNVTYEDSGLYKCSVKNVIGEGYGYADLKVLIAPRPFGTIPTFTTRLNTTATIYVRYIASPAPEPVVWRFPSGEVISNSKKFSLGTREEVFHLNNGGSRVKRHPTGSGHVHGHVSSLTIYNVDMSDVNVTYTADISNDIGSNIFKLLLVARDHPQPPTAVSIKCLDTQAELFWTSGFNGGAEQTFLVSYRNGTDNEWETPRLIRDPGLNRTTSVQFDDLNKESDYYFTLTARNAFGFETNLTLSCLRGKPNVTGAPVKPTSTTTTEEPVTVAGNWYFILIGVICGLILIALIIIVVCCVRHRREKNRHDEIWSRIEARNATLVVNEKEENKVGDPYNTLSDDFKQGSNDYVTDAYDSTYNNTYNSLFLEPMADSSDVTIEDDTIPAYSVVNCSNESLVVSSDVLTDSEYVNGSMIIGDSSLDDDDVTYGVVKKNAPQVDESATRV